MPNWTTNIIRTDKETIAAIRDIIEEFNAVKKEEFLLWRIDPTEYNLQSGHNGVSRPDSMIMTQKSPEGLLACVKQLHRELDAFVPPKEQWRMGPEAEAADVYPAEISRRTFWNETPIPFYTEMLFERFRELIGTGTGTVGEYELSVYDMSDESIFFKTREDVDSFLEEYDVYPATLFRIRQGWLEEICSW